MGWLDNGGCAEREGDIERVLRQRRRRAEAGRGRGSRDEHDHGLGHVGFRSGHVGSKLLARARPVTWLGRVGFRFSCVIFRVGLGFSGGSGQVYRVGWPMIRSTWNRELGRLSCQEGEREVDGRARSRRAVG
jgi:hypothetical protein